MGNRASSSRNGGSGKGVGEGVEKDEMLCETIAKDITQCIGEEGAGLPMPIGLNRSDLQETRRWCI